MPHLRLDRPALLVLIALAVACSEAPVAPTPPPDQTTPSLQDDPANSEAVTKTNAAADAFGSALQAKLKEGLASGPPEAITVCSEHAPAIAAQVAEEHGVTIGRSSLRLRNPANTGPDWVQAWLRDTGERKAEGLKPRSSTHGPAGNATARVLRPLEVGAVCLTCHGAELSAEVEASLAEKYPQDAARGYALGDLRGVLWVEAPIGG